MSKKYKTEICDFCKKLSDLGSSKLINKKSHRNCQNSFDYVPKKKVSIKNHTETVKIPSTMFQKKSFIFGSSKLINQKSHRNCQNSFDFVPKNKLLFFHKKGILLFFNLNGRKKLAHLNRRS